MRCSFCGYEDSKVLDSRPVDDGKCIRRRRECQECGKRFTTYERMEDATLIVVKKDNRREVFDGSKILNGLIKACDKRSVPIAILEKMVFDIEKDLRNSLEKEIPSQLIGEMIIERLRLVDEVAYVRFASVYRKFEDIETFMEEIRSMIKDSSRNKDDESSEA